MKKVNLWSRLPGGTIVDTEISRERFGGNRKLNSAREFTVFIAKNFNFVMKGLNGNQILACQLY